MALATPRSTLVQLVARSAYLILRQAVGGLFGEGNGYNLEMVVNRCDRDYFSEWSPAGLHNADSQVIAKLLLHLIELRWLSTEYVKDNNDQLEEDDVPSWLYALAEGMTIPRSQLRGWIFSAAAEGLFQWKNVFFQLISNWVRVTPCHGDDRTQLNRRFTLETRTEADMKSILDHWQYYCERSNNNLSSLSEPVRSHISDPSKLIMDQFQWSSDLLFERAVDTGVLFVASDFWAADYSPIIFPSGFLAPLYAFVDDNPLLFVSEDQILKIGA